VKILESMRASLRRGLVDNGYGEVPIASEHVIAIDTLPSIHKDPFDRLLIAQAMVQAITLLTDDAIVLKYQSSARTIRASYSNRNSKFGLIVQDKTRRIRQKAQQYP
jgi:PIN domain nuclease of toxin-antitoxin system